MGELGDQNQTGSVNIPRDIPPQEDSRAAHRQFAWGEMRKRVSRNIDSLDPGARDLVTGFTLMGIKTFGSCEGHLESGPLHTGQRGKKYDLRLYKVPYVAFNSKSDDLEKSREARCVTQLIDDFYQDREADPIYRVVITELRPFVWQVTPGDKEQTVSSDDRDEVRELAEERMTRDIEEMQAFSHFVKNKFLTTGYNVYTGEDSSSSETASITRGQVIVAFRKFVDGGLRSPDHLDSFDPEVEEAYELLHNWEKQGRDAAEREEVEEVQLTQDAYLRHRLDRETILVDAGFTSPGYIEEVAEEIDSQLLDFARRVGSSKMYSNFREKIEQLYVLAKNSPVDKVSEDKQYTPRY